MGADARGTRWSNRARSAGGILAQGVVIFTPYSAVPPGPETVVGVDGHSLVKSTILRICTAFWSRQGAFTRSGLFLRGHLCKH